MRGRCSRASTQAHSVKGVVKTNWHAGVFWVRERRFVAWMSMRSLTLSSDTPETQGAQNNYTDEWQNGVATTTFWATKSQNSLCTIQISRALLKGWTPLFQNVFPPFGIFRMVVKSAVIRICSKSQIAVKQSWDPMTAEARACDLNRFYFSLSKHSITSCELLCVEEWAFVSHLFRFLLYVRNTSVLQKIFC